MHNTTRPTNYDDTPEDQYDTLLRSLEEGVILSINNSLSAGGASYELTVESSKSEKTFVWLNGPDDSYYQIYRDDRGELVYAEVAEDGLEYQDEVITLEILGLEE